MMRRKMEMVRFFFRFLKLYFKDSFKFTVCLLNLIAAHHFFMQLSIVLLFALPQLYYHI